MKRRPAKNLTVLALLLAVVCASSAAQAPDTAVGSKGMVVAVEPFAAEAGVEILKKGGNAVDAAVAVAFALAVTHPGAGNIGGGGFMLIRLHNGTSVMIDYREMAPAAATWNMYLDTEEKLIPDASTLGWKAAGVPGTVAGMELALTKYGTMTFKEVMEPAIRLAGKGFPLSESLAQEFQSGASRLSQFPESRHIFLRNGRFYQPGELFRQKNLAKTLKKIAKHGAREFYRGSIAKRLAREMKRHGGLITREDLRNYRAVERTPLTGHFRDYEIISASPPSSGGIALIEMLNLLDPLLPHGGDPLAPATMHRVAESMRRAFADRARFLADPDFACIPIEALTNTGYSDEFRQSFNAERATPSDELSLPDPGGYGKPACGPNSMIATRESDETTHFSIMDAAGNAVSNTYTINGWFGSKVTVPGLGFLLNNEMDDFTVQPGATNALFELVQSDANKIGPGKRPLSSMTPTIVARNGKTILVLGSPGGPRIINAVFHTILNRLVFGDDLALAVARPRYHHQWIPDVLFVEEGKFSREQIEALRALGHQIRERGTVGQVNAIERDPATGRLYGVSDIRRKGVARGY